MAHGRCDVNQADQMPEWDETAPWDPAEAEPPLMDSPPEETADSSPWHQGEDQPDERFRRWSTKGLLAADRTFRWTIRGLLTASTYGMVGGERKTLKSYFVSFVNVALASGIPLFGRFEVDEPRPVVAYVGEGGRIPYTRRLERIAASMGVALADIPLISCFDTAPVTSARFKESLHRDLEELRPGLVLLDPLYAFHGTKTNAANLFEEGALLTSLSTPCLAAGASLMVVTHFNKTGTGRGLDRLTMAGAQEWADSWWLLSHRERLPVESGQFRLLLEVGSRQWGGSEWDLDLELGRFNVETGEYDGAIAWDLRRHTGSDDHDDAARVLRVVHEQPFALTKEEVVKAAGGQAKRMRSVVEKLDEQGLITPRLCSVLRSNGRQDKAWLYGPPSDVGRTGTEGAE